MSSQEKYICIHGHFYQPPRENPWLEEVELQESAYPEHDWNERITAQCYGPNSQSRILDADNKIIAIDNTYAKISFNFGPTLLCWMERHAQESYRNILIADKESQKRFSGHGSAIAQAYNHMIMPLANERDKKTQVYWGIKDFEYRFGRFPEGMWLPETAVDIPTLEALAERNIKFTILAPHQAKRIRKIGDKRWKDVSNGRIDPQRPYLCCLPSGKKITLFFYDGPIAHDVAFGDLLKNGENFANRLLGAYSKGKESRRLVHIATDGETYGHHHRYGDMALAYCLYHIEHHQLAQLTVYGEYLERFPPLEEVEIIENTSWSCIHGIERWRMDCGCHTGRGEGWHQKWRKPLRETMDWVRDSAAAVYETEMKKVCEMPWELRNRYIDVILDRSTENVERFFEENFSGRQFNTEEKIRILKLLELQRHAMLMFTSCGWFFDDISGIETTQILQYATRAIQLAKEVGGSDLEAGFEERLEKIPGNRPSLSNGRIIYEKIIKPSMIDLRRVGAHYAVSSLFQQYSQEAEIYSFSAKSEKYDLYESGRQKLVIGRAKIRSNITWEEETVCFSVLHLGDHNLTGGIQGPMEEAAFSKMEQEIKGAFKKNDIPRTIRLIEEYFKGGLYSLWHLFKDEQSRILYQILAVTLQDIELSLRQMKDQHYPIFQVVKQLRIPLPKILTNTVLVMLNKDILEALDENPINFEHLQQLVEEIKEWGLEIDRETLSFFVRKKINILMENLAKDPHNKETIRVAANLLQTLHPLSLPLDLWRAQNIYFFTGKAQYPLMKERAEKGDQTASQWIALFGQLGDLLNVKIQ